MEDQNQEEQMCQTSDHADALLKADVFTMTVNKLVDASFQTFANSEPAANAVDWVNLINRLATYREQFYRTLSTFDTFGRGWLRRNDEIRKQALKMV